MCLAQGHHTVSPMRLEPATFCSPVKQSTTEPFAIQAFKKNVDEYKGRYQSHISQHGIIIMSVMHQCWRGMDQILTPFSYKQSFNHWKLACYT